MFSTNLLTFMCDVNICVLQLFFQSWLVKNSLNLVKTLNVSNIYHVVAKSAVQLAFSFSNVRSLEVNVFEFWDYV